MYSSTNLYISFLTHHNLQGSQTNIYQPSTVTEFLTHHNLQGSQTQLNCILSSYKFLTHHNLQGSQTTPVATFVTA